VIDTYAACLMCFNIDYNLKMRCSSVDNYYTHSPDYYYIGLQHTANLQYY